MEGSMKKFTFAIMFTVSCSLLYGWYPDYTILATDFQIRQDYLAPTKIRSVGLMGLGNHFLNIYNHPLDNVFLNPAYLSYGPDNYIYLDLASEEFEPRFNNVPGIGYDGIDIYSPYPYYWSPYTTTETVQGKEPLFRAVYLGKIPTLPLRFGITAEYFYNEEDFYRPYWYRSEWYTEAAGGAEYSDELIDPYTDYRLVETGTNTETNTGYRLNSFLAIPLFNWLSLGVGTTLHLENSDGTYRDMDRKDDNNYADEYLRYSNSYKNRKQNFDQAEVRAGLIWSPKETVRFGVSAGFTPGSLSRTYVVTDTSNYFSLYNVNQPDSSIYRSFRRSDNIKKWDYDGNSVWASVHADITIRDGFLLRFSVHTEDSKADLDESEDFFGHSYYHRTFLYTANDTSYRYISESDSWATMDRIGRGDFLRKHQQITAGVDWSISPSLRFVGGLSFDYLNQKQEATEPFEGEKFSQRLYNGYSWTSFYDKTTTQLDDKQFAWWYERTQTILAVPIGVFVDVGNNIEIQVGFTKLMKQIDVEEGYDLIVNHESSTTIVDGITITEEDSAYVEGHEFPGDHHFSNKFNFNAGISIKHKDRFKLTAVITESIVEPRSLKIGAQILW